MVRNIITICLIIGLYICIALLDLGVIKLVGLIFLPMATYLLSCQSGCGYRIRLDYLLALGLAGGLFWTVVISDDSMKILSMIVSIGLAGYVAIGLIFKEHRKWMGLICFLLIIIGSPVLLGFNPYVVTECENILTQHWGYQPEDGVYIIEKEDSVGLRDRYMKILDTKYDMFEPLDYKGNFIATMQHTGTSITNVRCGIYDVEKQRFVLHPDSITITEVIQVGKLKYELRDGLREHFATLYLPGGHEDRMEFLREPLIESKYPEAYVEVDLSGKPPLIEEVDEDLNETARNCAAENLVKIAKSKTVNKYFSIVKTHSAYKPCYLAWYALMAGMENYLTQETYGEPYYTMQPIQFYADMRIWYEQLLEYADLDRVALSGERDISFAINDSLSQDTIDAFFKHFDMREYGGYNKMWYWLRPLFEEIRVVRRRYSKGLPEDVRRNFDKATLKLEKYLFNEIQALVETRNDEANLED